MYDSAVGSSVVCGIAVDKKGIYEANSDYRKGGDVAGVDEIVHARQRTFAATTVDEVV